MHDNQVKIIHEKNEEEEDEVEKNDEEAEEIFMGVKGCPNGAILERIEEDIAEMYKVSPKSWRCVPARIDSKI